MCIVILILPELPQKTLHLYLEEVLKLIVLYFYLAISDSSKNIFVATHQPGNIPRAAIDSMPAASQVYTKGMIITQSFYLEGSAGGMGVQSKCLKKNSGCQPLLSGSPAHFNLRAGRFFFQI